MNQELILEWFVSINIDKCWDGEFDWTDLKDYISERIEFAEPDLVLSSLGGCNRYRVDEAGDVFMVEDGLNIHRGNIYVPFIRLGDDSPV